MRGRGTGKLDVWAIVPVKPLRHGKSRLSDVLTAEERFELNRQLLGHTVSILEGMAEIENVLVVSQDQEALSLAKKLGAQTVQENEAGYLNRALKLATAKAVGCVSRSILVVPADLPLITANDLHAMLALSRQPPVVVAAPDRRRQGTNALLINPIGLIDYEFGPDSFNRHCRQAQQAGARLEIIDLPSLALDVDLPEDLQMVTNIFESYRLEAVDRKVMMEKVEWFASVLGSFDRNYFDTKYD